MANFTEISSKYENDAIVQRSASEVLFDLLDIQPNDNVLDLGCGTGHISKVIRAKTSGKVVGVDPSEGMIEKAKEKYSNQGITFRNCHAEELDYKNEFEIVFCNSAFQWFKDHKKALVSCHNALKNKGKIAIQAPAREDYCPNFIEAIDSVKRSELTKDIFSSFTSPWLFLNTSEDYTRLFEEADFTVEKSWIDKVVTYQSPEEVYKIFESGAAAGYLNSKYYNIPVSKEYVDAFRKVIRKSFEEQIDNTGRVRLIFYRIGRK
ncbi:MAG: methyltransferase domain-containing protein [Deltaproteobacteria bacterium]|nr:methyltransferase domain-containing protein [Deltaproteobacteria bacterium]